MSEIRTDLQGNSCLRQWIKHSNDLSPGEKTCQRQRDSLCHIEQTLADYITAMKSGVFFANFLTKAS
ncbi:hypothetical protein EHW99_0752 [Erwinia amylovora]|uniref:Uncharacterized protein n=2 Tax=Erwinia amylovora TaxID=552 RepID=A0A831EUG6_ERWAM|nr:hypothetical protein [Erwinia amylovora]EKV52860.1 hypothetical protein EaACW_2872 [Erwinia amylovora ACW56400]CBA22522.1 hypothetical protein predicted by Glimmer/Critica [Erwinia amylovora CFBP1430]CCO79714.1 hypothetical protein BN432_2935 [Erwinia amylovora Ea356]CCO87276.1 hypothetical protein BN434_2906 [Erwinia amylovora CFBP 2585]CCO91073.1 hypothetical protein BN435_2921 [Erwinia amylovora 01SFR-BO]CCO94856.1 hypothetical protein BN437_2946 [Erwinia amylovora NBRC 12687 = CFBP 123